MRQICKQITIFFLKTKIQLLQAVDKGNRMTSEIWTFYGIPNSTL